MFSAATFSVDFDVDRIRRNVGVAQIAGVWGDTPTLWTGNGETVTPLIHQIWDDPNVESSCQVSVQCKVPVSPCVVSQI